MVKAYLFGSYLKETDNKSSDIDIALVVDNLPDEERFDVQVQLMLLASEYDLRIEPHPISGENFDIKNPFAAEILRTGFEIEPEMPEKWFG